VRKRHGRRGGPTCARQRGGVRGNALRSWFAAATNRYGETYRQQERPHPVVVPEHALTAIRLIIVRQVQAFVNNPFDNIGTDRLHTDDVGSRHLVSTLMVALRVPGTRKATASEGSVV